MRPADSGVKLTYDDYVLFPDDGQRHELIDGEHFVTPAPIWKHQAIVTNLTAMIWSYLERDAIGRVFGPVPDVILSHFDVVLPDVLYLSLKRMSELERSNWIKGVPNLVVEVASPSTHKRDATIKKRLYERVGVDEYWIIDPKLDAITVFRRSSDRYGPGLQLSVERGDVLTTPLLPGLELPLPKIFAD